MCRSDPVIKMIDLDAWNNGRSKEDKKTEVKKSIMLEMRRLAVLYCFFKEVREDSDEEMKAFWML